jgi:hypothetical protein
VREGDASCRFVFCVLHDVAQQFCRNKLIVLSRCRWQRGCIAQLAYRLVVSIKITWMHVVLCLQDICLLIDQRKWALYKERMQHAACH